MKRFHVHVAVRDLEKSTRFYSAMFGRAPTVSKPDYAKWMIEDPRLNFAISTRGGAVGVNHLGFQAESAEELEEIHTRLQSADTAGTAEQGANCCYARSDKYWVADPSGLAWESFHSLGSIPFYGEPIEAESAASGGGGTSCCGTPVTAVATTSTGASSDLGATGVMKSTSTKGACCG